MTPLRDFCDFVQGGRLKLSSKHFVESGYPAYGAGGINGFVPQAEFSHDGIVLSAIGARCGKCFLAEGNWSSLANTQIIIPDPKLCDIKFLYHQLNDEGRWPRRGLAQPFIRPSDVKSHLVYLPPIGEQRRISSILQKVDAIRRNCNRSVELINQLTHSVFVEMFELGDKTSRIATKSLKSITTEIYRYPTYFGIEYLRDGIPEVRGEMIKEDGTVSSNIDDLRFISEETSAKFPKTRLEAGDLVMSVRGTIGKVGQIPIALQGANITANLIRISPDQQQILPSFLRAVLKSNAVQRSLSSVTAATTIATIKASDLRNMAIILPPMADQKKFCDTVEKISTQRLNVISRRSAVDALFFSLKHRAFTGQL